MSPKSSNFAGEMKIGHKGITFFCKYAKKSASFVKILHLTITALPFFSLHQLVSFFLLLSHKKRQAIVSNHLSIPACLFFLAAFTQKIDNLSPNFLQICYIHSSLYLFFFFTTSHLHAK